MSTDFINANLDPKEVQELIHAYDTIIGVYDKHERWFIFRGEKKPAELFGMLSTKKALWARWRAMTEDGTLERYMSVMENRAQFEKGGFEA